jgi:hypothetical protein
VAEVEPLAGFSPEEVLLAGILASRKENQDPIDNAIIAKGNLMSGLMKKVEAIKVAAFRPFDPVVKRFRLLGGARTAGVSRFLGLRRSFWR